MYGWRLLQLSLFLLNYAELPDLKNNILQSRKYSVGQVRYKIIASLFFTSRVQVQYLKELPKWPEISFREINLKKNSKLVLCYIIGVRNIHLETIKLRDLANSIAGPRTLELLSLTIFDCIAKSLETYNNQDWTFNNPLEEWALRASCTNCVFNSHWDWPVQNIF